MKYYALKMLVLDFFFHFRIVIILVSLLPIIYKYIFFFSQQKFSLLMDIFCAKSAATKPPVFIMVSFHVKVVRRVHMYTYFTPFSFKYILTLLRLNK